ncbi:hypothetical protein [Ralstonia pseudosolanacearum]|uniref:hypothetical protein n=1 Tax=Ralstonia pseudosolanacearum TaxID=1310165 RepID=UPI0032215F06
MSWRNGGETSGSAADLGRIFRTPFISVDISKALRERRRFPRVPTRARLQPNNEARRVAFTTWNSHLNTQVQNRITPNDSNPNHTITRHPPPATRHPAPGTTLKSLKINKTINSESGISTTSFNSGDGFILDKECFRKSAQKCA